MPVLDRIDVRKSRPARCCTCAARAESARRPTGRAPAPGRPSPANSHSASVGRSCASPPRVGDRVVPRNVYDGMVICAFDGGPPAPPAPATTRRPPSTTTAPWRTPDRRFAATSSRHELPEYERPPEPLRLRHVTRRLHERREFPVSDRCRRDRERADRDPANGVLAVPPVSQGPRAHQKFTFQLHEVRPPLTCEAAEGAPPLVETETSSPMRSILGMQQSTLGLRSFRQLANNLVHDGVIALAEKFR